jgi:2-oxoglutarate ferredoxin oxidoreductase subunit delta
MSWRIQEKMGKIVVDENTCKGCTLCVGACPFHLIRISKRINSKGYFPAEFVDEDHKCTGCTLCAIICPDVAIEVYREKKIGSEK